MIVKSLMAFYKPVFLSGSRVGTVNCMAFGPSGPSPLNASSAPTHHENGRVGGTGLLLLHCSYLWGLNSACHTRCPPHAHTPLGSSATTPSTSLRYAGYPWSKYFPLLEMDDGQGQSIPSEVACYPKRHPCFPLGP